MQRKNFIGFRDRVLLHLLRFEKEVYDNIHHGDLDGTHRDFLKFLTQEGIADGVGTKQSTIYKELQALRIPSLEGEEPLIETIDKIRIPGKERACSIYYLTRYGHDIASQKRSYFEKKNLEVQGLTDLGSESQLLTINELSNQLIDTGIENTHLNALLRIADSVSPEGKLDWTTLISPPQEVAVQPTSEKVSRPKLPTIPDIDNPYFNRIAIKDPKYFYGREEEVRYIISLLRNTQSCSIVGSRRIGKSSLINHVSNPEILRQHGLNPDDFIFIPIDLEGLGDITQSDFFGMIIEEIRNGIKYSDQRAKIEKILAQETIKFLDLKNIFRDISDQGINIIFLFDEFELITKNDNLDSNFYSGLRNLANSFNVGYITSSYVPLLELTLSKETLGSPFFNFFTQIDLSLMDESAVMDIITKPLQEYNKQFPDDIIDFIKTTAGPHPFFLQLLCFIIHSVMLDKGTVSSSDLPDILKRFKNEAQPHYQYFWNHLTPDEHTVLSIIQQGASSEALAQYKSILLSLKKKALITETPKGISLYSKAFHEYIPTLPLSETKMKAESLTSAHGPQQTVQVEWGTNYIVDEASPTVSVMVFQELASRGFPGLFITRTPTEKAEVQWNLKGNTIKWLCSRRGDDYLGPALEKISHTIFDFIRNNKHSVVLLDGVEFIINNNDFLKTLNLMENLKEIVAIHNSVLVIPMSSTIFSAKEFALLGKNSVEIPKNVKLDFTKV